MCGFANVQMCELMCGCADVRMCGCADVRMCGCADVQMGRLHAFSFWLLAVCE
jgi:hypothetical protein